MKVALKAQFRRRDRALSQSDLEELVHDAMVDAFFFGRHGLRGPHEINPRQREFPTMPSALTVAEPRDAHYPRGDAIAFRRLVEPGRRRARTTHSGAPVARGMAAETKPRSVHEVNGETRADR